MSAQTTPPAEALVISDDGETVVGPLKFTADDIFNRTSVVIGPTGSGKSYIIKHFLDLLRGRAPQALVVCPTEPANNSYAGYISKPMIHYNMTVADPKNRRKRLEGAAGAKAWLDLVWKRQEAMVSAYKRANRLKAMGALFSRIPREEQAGADQELAQIRQHKRAALEAVEQKFPDQYRRDKNSEKVRDVCDNLMRVVYKTHIRKHLRYLQSQAKSFSEEERCCIRHLSLNPHMVLILDDCAACLAPLWKMEVFKKLFYQNRHVRLTVIFALQDDTDLPPNLKKNVFVTIYTREAVCNTSACRTSGGMSLHKKKVLSVIEQVFAEKHRVFVHMREDQNEKNFYHFTAPPPEGKPFESLEVQQLCEKAKADENRIDKDNPFSGCFE